MLNCDANTGACSLPPLPDAASQPAPVRAHAPTVRYVGDPMCSWCWGVSPALKELAAYCAARQVNFSVHVGGLRAGGGDEWNAAFKAFLRHEWETITQVTGQPFGFSVLDKVEFNYDTEPACRAVVAMQHLLLEKKQVEHSQAVLDFFSGIQKQFTLMVQTLSNPISTEIYVCKLMCRMKRSWKSFCPRPPKVRPGKSSSAAVVGGYGYFQPFC